MRNKVVVFIGHQIQQIRNSSWSGKARKIGLALSMLVCIPLIFLVRLLKPLVFIRFGRLPSGRIGQLTCYPQNYLCEREVGMQPKAIDLFYHTKPICNEQLGKMWDRTLPVFSFVKLLDKANHLLPGGEAHSVPLTEKDNLDRDIHGLMAQTKAGLFFLPEEERMGEEKLREYGVSKQDSFICIHARSTAYLEKAYPGNDWNYHSFRDSNIQDLLPAADELTGRNYHVFRMGAVVNEPLTSHNPQIIDYSRNGRTDFMDIYLGSKCRFYLGDSCGIAAVPMIFRRPLALINMIPLEFTLTWSPDYLFIPKKLWLRKEKRFLRFEEIIGTAIGRDFLRSEQYEQAGIDVINNTADEIKDLAVEMDERLKGTWQTTDEDEELQRIFWKLFKPSRLHQVLWARIGKTFLRQNSELLGLQKVK